MPTRWDSSKRPLFVRTVFVNGSRHAILSQEDPHCQPTGPSSRKQSRPNSCQSYTSSSSLQSTRSKQSATREIKVPAKSQGTAVPPNTDLQGCIVKLRLVLASNETKPKTNSERFNMVQEPRKTAKAKPNAPKQKRKKSNLGKTSKKKSLRYFEENQRTEDDMRTGYHETTKYYSYDNNQNIIDQASYYIIDTGSDLSNSSQSCSEKEQIRQQPCCCGGVSKTEAEPPSTIEKPTEFAYTKPPNHNSNNSSADIPWNSISADSYFTRPYYNPLSERVMQWLDLASKRCKSVDRQSTDRQQQDDIALENIERIVEGRTFLDENNMSKYRDRPRPRKNRTVRSKSEVKSVKRDNSPVKIVKEQSKEVIGPTEEEDFEKEVKQEEDIETVLSKEVVYPKYSKELNRLHSLKSVQGKTEEGPETLQQKEETQAEENGNKPGTGEAGKHVTARRGTLQRQAKLENDSEDDDQNKNNQKPQVGVRQRRSAFYQRNSLFHKTVENTQTVSCKGRRDAMKRTKTKSITEEEQATDNNLDVPCKPLCQQVALSPRLQNKIPWLRDYQTGGKNMWPTERGASKPQLHIFMPAIAPKIEEAGQEDIEDAESVISEWGSGDSENGS